MSEPPNTIEIPTDSLDQWTHRRVVRALGQPLPEFLDVCAQTLRQPNADLAQDETFTARRNVFLRAGLASLSGPRMSSHWVQYGVRPADNVSPWEVYQRIAEHAREYLNRPTVKNFFFMHKPPGFRLRYEVAPGDRVSTMNEVAGEIETWKRDGLVDRASPGFYEPEMYLFGGHRSMKYVHDLFTVDSLAWLDFGARDRQENHPGDPSWGLSLLMLRGVFAELGITDYEDFGVWDVVRSKTGRRLPDEIMREADFSDAAMDIQAAWRGVAILHDDLSPDVREIADRHNTAVRPIARKWVRNYFSSQHATIGPREAAAFYTIFHWNRAALSAARQAMLVESMLYRGNVQDATVEPVHG